jgi:hypothetical protein
MTAQINDTFWYRGDAYSLVGVAGRGLASPAQFGMEPEMMGTACYRGFYAVYELTDEAMHLKCLALNEKHGKYPPIDGVEATRLIPYAEYKGLNVSIPFTGKLRLAKDLVEELYVHMGFQKPTAFKTVLDITLEKGQIIDVEDRSREMEQKRGAFKERYESGNPLETIEQAFSLDMDLE